MSRSFKRTPITGFTTAVSEKEDKKIWHSALRSAEREFLSKININTDDSDVLIEPVELDVSNVWDFAKDGKKLLDLKNPESLKYIRK